MASWGDPHDRPHARHPDYDRYDRTRHESRPHQSSHTYDIHSDSRHSHSHSTNRPREKSYNHRSPHRHRHQRWPPSPKAEDEHIALAKEHLPEPVTSDDEPVSRGSIDQDPAIEEVPEYIPDRRFVLLPTDGKTTSSPVTSDDERLRRGRHKASKPEPAGLPEMMREPSPYAWTKPKTIAGKSSLGETVLSPDATLLSAGPSCDAAPRKIPPSAPSQATPNTSTPSDDPATRYVSSDRRPIPADPHALPKRQPSPRPRRATSSSEEKPTLRKRAESRTSSANLHQPHDENADHRSSAPDMATTSKPTDKLPRSSHHDLPYRPNDLASDAATRKHTNKTPRSSHDLSYRPRDLGPDVATMRNTDKTPQSSYHDLRYGTGDTAPPTTTTFHARKTSENLADADAYKSSSRRTSARYTASPPYSPVLDANQPTVGAPQTISRPRADSQTGSSHHSSPQPSPRLSKSSFAADAMRVPLAAAGLAGVAAALHHRGSASRLTRNTASEARDALPRRTPTSHPVHAHSQLPYPDDEGDFLSMPLETDHQYIHKDRGIQSDPRDHQAAPRSATPTASMQTSHGRPLLSTRNSGFRGSTGSLNISGRGRSTSSARPKTAADLKIISRDLPVCPRPNFTSEYDDWYTLEGCPHFDICPECLSTIFQDTVYKVYFKQSTSRRSLHDGKRVEVRCDFNNAWIRLGWLLTVKREIPSLDLIKALVDQSSGDQAEEPCPESRPDVRNWYSVRDGHGHFLRTFAVCSADVRKLQILFPGFRDLWQPLPMRASYSHGDPSGGLRRLCSLRPMRNNRFAVFVDALVAYHEPGYMMGRLPDATDFVSLVRHKHFLHECERDNMVVDGDWHFIPSLLPAMTVCEDCYDDVILPLVKADSDIAMRFNMEARMVPDEGRLGVSCQLYSERMRDVFRYAVQDKNLSYLDRKSMERREMEERLQRRRLEIEKQVKALQSESARYGRSADMQAELKLLVREERDLERQWADWE